MVSKNINIHKFIFFKKNLFFFKKKKKNITKENIIQFMIKIYSNNIA